MDLSSITPLILTYNEEVNIGRTLDRLTWASRIVVVDSYSEDDTVDIACSYENVDVVPRAFDNHTGQWNFGLEQVDTEWVLSLDADYQVPPDFVDEAQALSPKEDIAGYRATFSYCIQGKPLRGSLYPPRIVLFRQRRAYYVQDGHTQRLAIEGATDDLATAFKHDDRKPLSRWLDSQRQYARLEAGKLATGDEETFVDRLRALGVGPILTPLYCLFLLRLILDGRAGLYYTLQRTYAELLLALYLHDYRVRDDASL